MRIGLKRRYRPRRRELWVATSQGEAVNASQLRALREAGCPQLLQCSGTVGQDGEKARLVFEVTGTVSLERWLARTKMDRSSMRTMLVDVVRVMDWCLRHIRGEARLLFDPGYVFVDGRGHLLFALLPVEGGGSRLERSPLALIRALGDDRNVRFRSPEDAACAERVVQFALGERHAFSLNRLREFVDAEFAMAPLAAGEAPRHDGYLLRVSRTGDTYWLEGKRTYQLGRASSCDVSMPGAKLSRVHASLRCDPDSATIVDQGSTNGTWVAGRRVVPLEDVRIAYGQTFSLSDCSLLLEKG